MIKGETKSGFKFAIPGDTLDDWELLEDLANLDADGTAIIRVAKTLLGKDYDKLKDHLRKDGKVSATSMSAEIMEIMESSQESKKS